MMKWKDLQYNGCEMRLETVTISVYWDSSVSKGEPTGYRYRYAGFVSNKFYADIDEAKSLAVKSLKARLQKDLEAINDEA